MTSPDGITWTSRASAANNAWNEVTWSPELSLFAGCIRIRNWKSNDKSRWNNMD